MEPEALLITALSDIIKVVAEIGVEHNLTAKQVAAQGGGRHLQTVVSGVCGRLQPDVSLIGTSFDERTERERAHAIRWLQRSFLRTGVHKWIALSIADARRATYAQRCLRRRIEVYASQT